jgi:hypothetical protein
VWAIFGRNAESKKNKADDVKAAPTTATDNKEKPSQKKGIGSNLDPEF